jgi:hypothetical protein
LQHGIKLPAWPEQRLVHLVDIDDAVDDDDDDA